MKFLKVDLGSNNKFSKLLEEQKYETLNWILTNADDYETILNEPNYYVMVDKQKRQIQQVDEAESRTEIGVIITC